MRGLMAIFKMRFGLVLNYRMAAIAGLFTQMFFGFVFVMIFIAFFDSNPNGDYPMTLEQTVSYLWLGQALLILLPWNGDREIMGMIRNGDFAYELVRPIDTYNYWFYRIVAQRIAGTILRAAPLIIMATYLVPAEARMGGPVSLSGLGMFLLTIAISLVLGGAISNIITLSVLFTIGDGIERLVPAVVMLLSGMTIPLAFFPDWSQAILKWLPFSGLVDGPYRFYLGLYTVADLPMVIGHQVMWSALLILLGRYMVTRARQRIVVQGG